MGTQFYNETNVLLPFTLANEMESAAKAVAVASRSSPKRYDEARRRYSAAAAAFLDQAVEAYGQTEVG